MLFFTGITRSSDKILSEQKKNIDGRWPVLRQLRKMAYDARQEIENGNLDTLGELLHESWELKKQLATQISNTTIDQIYEAARKAGALGGKITGAGAVVS